MIGGSGLISQDDAVGFNVSGGLFIDLSLIMKNRLTKVKQKNEYEVKRSKRKEK